MTALIRIVLAGCLLAGPAAQAQDCKNSGGIIDSCTLELRTPTIPHDCMTPGCPGIDDQIAVERQPWHLLTQSRGGTITLLKDLTQHECEFARARAMGEPATDAEKAAAKTREDARAKRASEWLAAHHCKNVGSTSGESQVTPSGTCYIGSDVDPDNALRITTEEPGDIIRAECFQ